MILEALPIPDAVRTSVLSRNGFKEFTLHSSGEDYYRLGLQLYSCLELTHLNIHYCKFNPLVAFKGFPNLTILELCLVIVNEKFGDVITACPQLERVSVRSCHGLHNLVLRAPNLQNLCRYTSGLKTICLSSTEHLASFSINLGYEEGPGGMEKLCLGDTILEFSAASSVPKRLPASLINLKKIILSHVDFNDVAQIACTLCLIQSSPKLSELEIWGQYKESGARQDLNFLEEYGDHDFSFGKLQFVKLMFLRASKAEMAVIRLLLAHSPLLEHMFIKVDDEVDIYKSHSMCKKLMRFGRASPKAELIYFGSIYPN